MIPIKQIIDTHTERYLIVDGVYPIITSSSVLDEASIYNLSDIELSDCISDFIKTTDKTIDGNTLTTELSFGQKIILSMLLSVFSKSENILFHKVQSSINPERFIKINKLIKTKFPDKIIKNSNE